MELREKKVLLNFELGRQSVSKKLLLKGGQDRQPLHLEFKGRKKEDILTVSVFLNRPNTTLLYKIGEGHRLLNELDRNRRAKIFLTVRAKVNGFLFFHYKLFREKEIS